MLEEWKNGRMEEGQPALASRLGLAREHALIVIAQRAGFIPFGCGRADGLAYACRWR
jgi:hypothetical protein